MIDQRGTGAGSLDCPELQRQMGESNTVPPTPAAVQACAQALGIRRDFFTTANTVKDLGGLRQALHLASWTLDGVSYGTFTAEQYALTYPDRVRRLVLDSSVTQQNADPLYVASMHRAAFVLRQACQEQHCGYDPAAELASVIARYGYAVRLFDILVILSIIDPQLRTFLPRLHQAATGNPGPLRSLITGFYAGPPVMPQVYSSGLHAATLCADLTDMPWGNAAAPLGTRAAALQRALQRIPATATWPFPVSTAAGQGIMQECRYWPPARPDPPPPNRTLTMPVLLLSGAWICPPRCRGPAGSGPDPARNAGGDRRLRPRDPAGVGRRRGGGPAVPARLIAPVRKDRPAGAKLPEPEHAPRPVQLCWRRGDDPPNPPTNLNDVVARVRLGRHRGNRPSRPAW